MALGILTKKNLSSNPSIDFEWVRRNESKHFFINKTNLGAEGNIQSGTVMADWRPATKTTVVARRWSAITSTEIQPQNGRYFLINKIYIILTDACAVGIRHQELGSNYGLDGNKPLFLTGVFADSVRYQESPTGGVVEFDFVKNEGQPRKVKCGEQIIISLATTPLTTTQTDRSNYHLIVDGEDLTDDENYGAEFTIGGFCDSLGVPLSDIGEFEDSNRTVVKHGLWPFMVRNHLKDLGIDCRLSNLSIEGYRTDYAENKVNRGLFNSWKPDVLLLDLGINDCTSLNYFRTAFDTDGIYMTGYKSIIRSYLRAVPNGCVVMLQITDTDTATRVVTFASGIYSGLRYLDAIRVERTAVLTQMRAEIATTFPNAEIIDADTSPANTFLASDKTNYITAEQGAGLSLHHNARVGQPKIAAVVNPALDTSNFVINNRKII